MSAPMVRCSECRYGRNLHPGSLCRVSGRKAGGRYLRACIHHESTTAEPLERLRALPGVAIAEERAGRLWLRFHRHATSEQRDRVTELLTGRRPTLSRFAPKPAPSRARKAA